MRALIYKRRSRGVVSGFGYMKKTLAKEINVI